MHEQNSSCDKCAVKHVKHSVKDKSVIVISETESMCDATQHIDQYMRSRVRASVRVCNE